MSFSAMLIDVYDRCTVNTPRGTMTIAEALDKIRDGEWDLDVQEVRDIRPGEHSPKVHAARAAAKKQLPGLMFGGRCIPTRTKTNFTQHSGGVEGDLDNCTNIPDIRRALESDPLTAWCFLSVSGTGLKVGLHCPPVPDDATYKRWWQAAAAYHAARYELTWDPAAKDITRLCFVSHDPECYHNPDALEMPTPDILRRLTPLLKTLGDVPLGGRHSARHATAFTLGGMVASGEAEEQPALALVHAVAAGNTTDPAQARREIDASYQQGKKKPLPQSPQPLRTPTKTTDPDTIRALLDDLRGTETPDMHLVFGDGVVAATARMTDQAFALYRVDLQEIFGRNLRWMDVKNARKEAQRRHRQARDAIDPPQANDGKPAITITTDIPRVTDRGIAAMETLSEGTRLYQRAGRLVMLTTEATSPKGLKRPDNTTTLTEVSAARIRELAAEAADWVKYNEEKDETRSAVPPTWFADTVLGRPGWPSLPIEGLIAAPTMRLDGSILEQIGYDVDTGLYFVDTGVVYPPMPIHLTLDDAYRALTVLHEITCDFPFGDSGDRSAAWALLLTMMARHAINGNVPLFAITSTTSGTGKGKLADALCTVALGRIASKMAQADDDEERKTLMAIALAGDPVVLIDNVEAPLGGMAFDSALTAGMLQGRLLGQTKTVTVPLVATFLATGNNIRFKGDMPRRVVPVLIDAQQERPEERTDFTHMNLLAWVQQERPRLVMAALTVLAAFTQAGRPSQGLPQYGSFEAWSDLVRSALVWAGEEDPCKGRERLRQENDISFTMLAALLESWAACFPVLPRTGKTVPRTLKHILDEIDASRPAAQMPLDPQWQNLFDALTEFDPRGGGEQINRRSVGRALLKVEGRVINRKRLVRGGTAQRATEWCLEAL